MSRTSPTIEPSRWPHRWALVLACATFPLVWVGGLVTTTDAGMAVPDWPTTFGYNLFLYPWQTWLAGPWDLFVEHGHRLLAASVGMLTIGLLIVLWRKEPRHWVRWLGVAALALVIFQGILGGLRVRFDERTLAMLHGCTGPLFFALTVAMVVVTSRRWLRRDGDVRPVNQPDISTPAAGHIRHLAVATCVFAYLQILVGAVLRHVPIDSEPATFMHAVKFHLFLAAILALHILLLTWLVLRHARRTGPLAKLAATLCALLVVQILLGIGTWLAKYAVPAWAANLVPAMPHAIHADGWLQTHIVTAHVAVGSLILATSVAIGLDALRWLSSFGAEDRPARFQSAKLEAVR
jgi:cytochrome c oxidase assembly protein subunit 15